MPTERTVVTMGTVRLILIQDASLGATFQRKGFSKCEIRVRGNAWVRFGLDEKNLIIERKALRRVPIFINEERVQAGINTTFSKKVSVPSNSVIEVTEDHINIYTDHNSTLVRWLSEMTADPQ